MLGVATGNLSGSIMHRGVLRFKGASWSEPLRHTMAGKNGRGSHNPAEKHRAHLMGGRAFGHTCLMKTALFLFVICLWGVACDHGAPEETPLRVAVAANFKPILNDLAQSFQEETGIEVVVSTGSSGILFAQIENGAPFDIFLSADESRPRTLVQKELGKSETLFCYAQGRLVLACAQDRHLPQEVRQLADLAPLDLAIANPKLAPFGQAALAALGDDKETLQALGIKLVRGENVAQAWHFLVTGAVDYALVPLSMAQTGDMEFVEISTKRYEPIRQFGVVLARTRKLKAARRFMKFIRSSPSRERIEAAGYEVSRK